MDEWLKTVLLGVVEGATEFLPISSTGHLLIASRLVNFQENLGGTFEIFIQFGAVLAVIGFYAGGLLAGMDRPTATTFSFYLAIPTLGAATVYDLYRSLRGLSSGDLAFLLVGTLVSGIVAWIAIRWLLRYVAHHTLVPFGVYRVLAGGGLLAFVGPGRGLHPRARAHPR